MTRKIIFLLLLILLALMAFDIVVLIKEKEAGLDIDKSQVIRDFIFKKQEKEAVLPLTTSGIIEHTNIERKKNGLPFFIESKELNLIAQAKTEDMIKYDYFEHVSPKGEEISDLAEVFGYDFLLIAENLAYGEFEDDRGVVLAWMESLGHRENILNYKHKEIGVFATEKEKNVWVAVQVFALPRSVCPEVDKLLLAQIEKNKKALGELEQQGLIKEYNRLARETQGIIAIYNSQVQAFNKCIEYWTQ